MMIIIILAISLIGIVFGADWLVSGSVSIARKYNVSEFVIGAAIIGIGTSMPEFVVSLIGALESNSDIAVGNIVGSNIFNILGILGITALLFPISVNRSNRQFEIPVCIFVSILVTLFSINLFTGKSSVISRIDGIVLLILFSLYMWYSLHRDKKQKHAFDTEDFGTETIPIWIGIGKTVIGLAVLVISCDLFVDKSVVIAKSLGMNDAFISLTLIACGTSLPELAASIAAAVKKKTQLALGNIIGSNIFNITFILGICSQVMPLTSGGITITDYIVMIVAAIAPFLFGIRGKIGRAAGLLMVLSFIIYTLHLLNSQLHLLKVS